MNTAAAGVQNQLIVAILIGDPRRTQIQAVGVGHRGSERDAQGRQIDVGTIAQESEVRQIDSADVLGEADRDRSHWGDARTF